MVVAGASRLEVDVVKAVHAPVAPSFVRSVLGRMASMPEVDARLPDGACSVAVRVTGDRELRRLNRAYAGIDSVTDVLSFEGSGSHLGDLAISWPTVVRQAERYGHSAQAELGLLCVHGMLHLLGWDHASASGHREMSRLTRDATSLSSIDVPAGRL